MPEISGDTLYGDTGDSVTTGTMAAQTLSLPADLRYLVGDAYELQGVNGANDRLSGSGEDSQNYVYGDARHGLIGAAGGKDRIDAGANCAGIGDADFLQDGAVGGNDKLSGGALYGDVRGHMSQGTRGGKDVLTGTPGMVSNFFGDAGGQMTGARGGNDLLIAAEQDTGTLNTLYGDAGYMYEGSRGGNDTLQSAHATDDWMWGDATQWDATVKLGRDTFIFAPENGQDRIYDFQHGKDIIDLTAFASVGIHSFADLDVRGNSGDFIVFDDDNHLYVLGVTL